MNLQQISFSIPDTQYAALAKRAGPMNVRPAEYAKRLFDAAYHVRTCAEKGVESPDPELDRAVKQTFLLADAKPAAIADAVGIPVSRVERILDGWRVAAKMIAAPLVIRSSDMPVPPPALPPANVAPAEARTSYPVETIRRLWADGKTAREIAAAIGKSASAVQQWVNKNRAVCPKRRGE